MKALARFHEIMPSVKKKGSNGHFSSTYATLDDILEAIKMPLKESGLTFTQIPIGEDELKTIIFHVDSGENIEGLLKLMPAKRDPQGQGSALTYGKRYALSAMLGINTEEDDDGNAAVGRAATPVATRPAPLSPLGQEAAMPAYQSTVSGTSKPSRRCGKCSKEHNGPYATCYTCYKAGL